MPSKYLLFILTVLCTVMMLVTFGTDVFNRPLNVVVGYVIVPFQQGIEKVGGWLSNRSEELVQIRTLLDENAELKAEVAALIEENTLLQQDKYELNKLRELFELDGQYAEYNKVGARIIGRDSGNWYSSFLIDKGEDDGLEVDMNVIAQGGLVGRITSVGPSWARVTSIISDNVHVSAMTLSTEDNMTVTGDLRLMAEGCITFSQLVDGQDSVREGDKVVTSNISDKYLPNILIGYISSISKDANNLTKSGEIVPAVDFEHLEEVLIITDRKESVYASKNNCDSVYHLMLCPTVQRLRQPELCGHYTEPYDCIDVFLRVHAGGAGGAGNRLLLWASERCLFRQFLRLLRDAVDVHRLSEREVLQDFLPGGHQASAGADHRQRPVLWNHMLYFDFYASQQV